MKTNIKSKAKALFFMPLYLFPFLFLSSCNDFLETEPGTGYTVDEVFSTNGSAKMLLKQIYSQWSHSWHSLMKEEGALEGIGADRA